MKKISAILIGIVMIASGFQVSIDHHFCGGVLAATKLSVTGKLASCGMKMTGHSHTDRSSIEKKCCEDQLLKIVFNSNYIPEFSNHSASLKVNHQTSVPVCDLILNSFVQNGSSRWVLPPGTDPDRRITLSSICVFRI